MATRKVFDIIPPKERREIAPPVKPEKKPIFSKKSILADKTAVSKKVPIAWGPVLIVLVLICSAAAAYLLIKPKAEISIWPRKSPLVVKTQIVVGNDIAGEIKTQECSSSQEFSSTGIKSLNTKASGTIRVYNAYSTSPQTLIANTRFVSDNGKLFKTPQKIIIPGAHYEGSKLIPGEIDARVEAGEAGEEYNIGPSTFSLPALAGTSRYTAFYAKSSAPMTGGLEGQTAQITEEDLASAEDSLAIVALDNCRKTLRDSLQQEEYIIDDEAFKSEVVDTDSLVAAGQAVEKFTLNIKAETTALVFKKSDLENFAVTYITSKVSEGKQLDNNSVAISYLVQSVDLNKSKIVLSVEISAEIYSTVDENGIKEAVMSQNPKEASQSLKRFSEINDSQIRLWPFWADKTPQAREAITIKIRLD